MREISKRQQKSDRRNHNRNIRDNSNIRAANKINHYKLFQEVSSAPLDSWYLVRSTDFYSSLIKS